LSRIGRSIALIVAVFALLAAPSAAQSAAVTNGDFETGDFSGWHEDYVNPGSGHWFVYTGTLGPLSGVSIPLPPQGTHAAISDQSNVSRQILYQDVTVPTGGTVNRLSLFAYYTATGPFVSPNSLQIGVPNEQYRIDVIKPGAAIDSVASGDVLLTIFRTQAGDPVTLAPTQKTADLSAFAGQTVRLRFAVVTTNSPLDAGIDAVDLKSNSFAVGQIVRNKKKGTARVPFTLPDAGNLAASAKGVKISAVAATSGGASVNTGAGTATLVVKAKGKTLQKLNATGKAKVKLSVTYTPNGVSANTQTVKLKLKKKR
jgi:hypothetical protein